MSQHDFQVSVSSDWNGAFGGEVGSNSDAEYEIAMGLVEQGQLTAAEAVLKRISGMHQLVTVKAFAANDLGVLDAAQGRLAAARQHFQFALDLDPACQTARENIEILNSESTKSDRVVASDGKSEVFPARTRVAILSLLFNWPSTGGGTIHTAETALFLSRAGYEVRHIYAHFPTWGLGRVDSPLDVDLLPLHFESDSWNAAEIQRRFRVAVDEFAPDYVIITDSWNFKPLLAEAVRGYRYFLRLAALECLCPLNNVRLLVNAQEQLTSCPNHQLATPDTCRDCVSKNRSRSGQLHQLERQLAGFEIPGYVDKLRAAFADAEAVLAVNPLIAAMVSPYAKQVRIVPSGFDPTRFPITTKRPPKNGLEKKRIFFAGLVPEYIKGFAVLHEACSRIWQRRQDFELVATADPIGQTDAFTTYVGWLSQSELPNHLQQADLLVFPTVAEEALGRSAVEGMAAGIPVIASRIGGLQFTVSDWGTGLLFEPGNVRDLESKIELLLDDSDLRDRLGRAGRKRFEEEFTWDRIIERHYRPLLGTLPGKSAKPMMRGQDRAPFSPSLVSAAR
ncbi:MAG: mshA 4 [Planctomycetaceae bacterium]|nr:mshA 4 [Planctomycetaceae bacterium]